LAIEMCLTLRMVFKLDFVPITGQFHY
jgi:hypothetical protein